ncbi:MAG: hypothetical protein AB1847_22265 [bacterium]
MWLTWLPWKYIVRRAARTHGFVDPIAIASHLQRFAQPSEVSEPIELLRAGMIFHARGLINTRAIQHNLDWIWPYWVQRQFDPLDHSFIPRAFSLTHVNLTHRNWTAVGIPDCRAIAIVDPRGLVTPFFDGWSIDGWILTEAGDPLLPSKEEFASQRLVLDRDNLSVVTETEKGSILLRVEVCTKDGRDQDSPVCRIHFQALTTGEVSASGAEGAGSDRRAAGIDAGAAGKDAGAAARDQGVEGIGIRAADTGARAAGPGIKAAFAGGRPPRRWLVIALRPYNPEGISFIHHIALTSDRKGWIINKKHCVTFNTQVDLHAASHYRSGDVYLSLLGLPNLQETESIECDVGLATAAALFELQQHQESEKREVSMDIRLIEDKESAPLFASDASRQSWSDAMDGLCRLRLPDQRLRFLYDAALRTLILHSPGEVYPGPYTYKRFWFRDAAFILQAMLSAGMQERAMRAVKRFPSRQTGAGFFRSQAGEWDSNGEALWIMHRLLESTGVPPKAAWVQSIIKGARWIKQKRLADGNRSLQAGLLPAGFSAEHLGPNDYYYWDDFWSVAGLRAAASMIRSIGKSKAANDFDREADALMQAIERSLERSLSIRGHRGIPASPYRRMDAGAIGSIVVSYPLRLWPPDDERVLQTADYLINTCFVDGAFFQDMIHSGLNSYLTLHLAQVLLRAGDSRFYDLVKTIADLASPTGQWPEASHPLTLGGCMGDGQHVWAAAEWIMMMRNMFVREEGERLILASGIAREWLDQEQALEFGPTLTPWGGISLKVEPHPQKVVLTWQASWRQQAPVLEVRLPGLQPRIVDAASKTAVEIMRA